MKIATFFLKYYKIIFLLNSIAMVVVCCKTTQPAPAAKQSTTNFATAPWVAPAAPSLAPVEADVAIAKLHWPGTTLDNLNQGYDIFYDKCTDCHSLEKPQDHSVNEWNVLMRKMGRKAKLDSNEYNLVFHYILTKRESILGPGK